jgi:rod shape-determining protein MreC
MLKKKLFLFAVFILLVFGLLTYQSRKGKGRFVDFPLYPLRILEQGTSTLIKHVKSIINSYILIVGKEKENKRLLDKINEFEQEINRYKEAEYENRRLRDILKLSTKRSNDVATAEVFARDPTNWFQMLWINKGSNDGIARDMVAVTPLGPVGRIHRVFGNGANIILITDVNSSVAVRLQPSRIEGILEGNGDDGCYLKYISNAADVKVGERIITSGLDEIYPEGLLIGLVVNVEKEGEEMFQLIEVEPAQDLNKIEEVAILKR